MLLGYYPGRIRATPDPAAMLAAPLESRRSSRSFQPKRCPEPKLQQIGTRMLLINGPSREKALVTSSNFSKAILARYGLLMRDIRKLQESNSTK
jgi:hypothetical protein